MSSDDQDKDTRAAKKRNNIIGLVAGAGILAIHHVLVTQKMELSVLVWLLTFVGALGLANGVWYLIANAK